MGELSRLPNISKVIEGKLIQAGIHTVDEFRALGSREAFIRIRLNDPDACLHMLYGLEGAVRGIRDTGLLEEEKQELKTFFKSL